MHYLIIFRVLFSKAAKVAKEAEEARQRSVAKAAKVAKEAEEARQRSVARWPPGNRRWRRWRRRPALRPK